jgi:hypothetical protein
MGDDYDEDEYIPRDYYDDDDDIYGYDDDVYGEGSDGEDSPNDSDNDGSSPTTVDPSDFGRVSHVHGIETDGGKKSLRSPRDVSLERLRGVFGDAMYSAISQEVKNSAYTLVSNIPEDEMVTYNIEILAPAALFMSMYPKKNILNSKNIADFMKKTSKLQNINHLDFIRYIRMLA